MRVKYPKSSGWLPDGINQNLAVMKNKVKTIDIQGKEWFDKVNGNSYFSAIVTVYMITGEEKEFKLPFQYGYEEAYKSTALKLLKDEGLINTVSGYELREQGIIVVGCLQQKCKQKDVKSFTS